MNIKIKKYSFSAWKKKTFIHFNKEATYAIEERVKFQNTSILIVSLLLSYRLT